MVSLSLECLLRLAPVVITVACNAILGIDERTQKSDAMTGGGTAGSGGQGGGGAGAAGSSSDGGTGGCSGTTSSMKRVFVTSRWFGSTELGNPDASCQSAARVPGLGGCWRAWVADATTDAVERVCPGGPWQRMDGVPVASDCTDLTDGTIQNPIEITENGDRVAVGVWTGTTVAGSADLHCDNWTSTDPMQEGTQGNSFSVNAEWSSAYRTSCVDAGMLYCFEQ